MSNLGQNEIFGEESVLNNKLSLYTYICENNFVGYEIDMLNVMQSHSLSI